MEIRSQFDNSPFELTIPSNDDEKVMCTSMWSFAHMTSSETIFGIPLGLSDGHSSFPADTKLNCGWKLACQVDFVGLSRQFINSQTSSTWLKFFLFLQTTLPNEIFNEHASSRESQPTASIVSIFTLFETIVEAFCIVFLSSFTEKELNRLTDDECRASSLVQSFEWSESNSIRFGLSTWWDYMWFCNCYKLWSFNRSHDQMDFAHRIISSLALL